MATRVNVHLYTSTVNLSPQWTMSSHYPRHHTLADFLSIQPVVQPFLSILDQRANWFRMCHYDNYYMDGHLKLCPAKMTIQWSFKIFIIVFLADNNFTCFHVMSATRVNVQLVPTYFIRFPPLLLSFAHFWALFHSFIFCSPSCHHRYINC